MESLSNKGKRCFIHENNKFQSYCKDQRGYEYYVSGAIPHTNNGAEAYHRHLNAEFYVKHPNINMFVDVLKKVQQTAYVAMNSVSQPACVAKHEREKRKFAVAAFYDYCTHALTRQQQPT